MLYKLVAVAIDLFEFNFLNTPNNLEFLHFLIRFKLFTYWFTQQR